MGEIAQGSAGVRARSRSVRAILRRLARAYGPVERHARLSPLDELIATLLSQSTSDLNSEAAFEALRRRFSSWDAVRRARTSTIATVIRRGGLANRKAIHIKAILEALHARCGEISLDFVCAMPVAEAYGYLRSLPGVGPKTAACVLLFACDKPVLPVDTHVHRVSERLRLIDTGTSTTKAHLELASLVPAQAVLEFHLQLIRHGRRVCLARRPHCGHCPLLDRCPHGRGAMRAA